MKLPALMLLIGAIGVAMHFQEIANGVTSRLHSLTNPAAPSIWLEDEPQALAKAKAEGKFLLLRFGGSDWCGVCQALEREALSGEEFKGMAAENFVLVDVDLPRHKSQPTWLSEQNRSLASQYQVRGLPTVIVLNSNGETVRQLHYRPGSPAMFLEELRTFQRVDRHL